MKTSYHSGKQRRVKLEPELDHMSVRATLSMVHEFGHQSAHSHVTPTINGPDTKPQFLW